METIQRSIRQLHGALRDYIEATYHISAESLIRKRKALLDVPGVIHQVPYLESTPRYKTGECFSEMAGLPQAALAAFSAVSKPEGDLPRLIYDPPYMHQSEAVRGNLIDRRNLVIMTGTGSGKTESFLLPILGKLAREASERPSAFAQQPAMRALVLYPMNALVNDQLGRLRSLFGDPRLVSLFNGWSGRPPRFGRYTSRTPYAGVRTSQKDSAKFRAFDDFYVAVERLAREPDAEGHAEAQALRRALKERGKWPAKPDLLAWLGEKGTRWKDPRTGEFVRGVTLPDDSELLTRHEIQGAPPDLLVTNYSMLEYMMMRPIERPVFDMTRSFLASNPGRGLLGRPRRGAPLPGGCRCRSEPPATAATGPLGRASGPVSSHLCDRQLQRPRLRARVRVSDVRSSCEYVPAHSRIAGSPTTRRSRVCRRCGCARSH